MRRTVATFRLRRYPRPESAARAAATPTKGGRGMKAKAGPWFAVVALLCAGCASAGTGADGELSTDDLPPAPFEVTVDNRMDWPVVVRIASLRVGEAPPTGITTFSMDRRGIAGRRVSVCVDPIGAGRRRCHPGQLVVPNRVQEIRITVPRVGQVRASAL